jgi:CRISPR-associated protein Csd1
MILEALYQLAQDEGLVDDPDFEVRPVAWIVEVGRDGALLGIRGTHSEVVTHGSGKTRLVPKSFRIPSRRTGKSGTKAPPDFMVENAKYVFGLGTMDKPVSREEGAEKSGWFQSDLRDCLAATGDDGIAAVLTLLKRHSEGQQVVSLPEECKSNDLFAFLVAPDVDRLLHLRPAITAYWHALRNSRNEGNGELRRCMITGAKFAGSPLVRLVKGVPGAASSGGALVSFNASAFESHGWDANENAPISLQAAEACSIALQRLLDERFRKATDPDSPLPVRHIRLGSATAVAFWAEARRGAPFLDIMAELLKAEDASRVGELFSTVWRGIEVKLDEPGRFYGLSVSGAQGRVVIRDWFETTVTDVQRNVAGYFGDLQVVRNTRPPKGGQLSPAIPMKALLGSLAPFGDQDAIPAPLAASLVGAALRGTLYPVSLLQRALERTRAEIGRTDWSDSERRDARAALMKAVLVRNYHLELTPAMNPDLLERGYLLGRLIAVIERLQQVALGNVNASVIDRYFGAASATPRAVFTRLLKSARHHARKAKDDPETEGAARWLDNMIDEISSRFDPAHNGFPAHLDLIQQGLFVLGYHQQRHFLWMSKEERETWKAAQPQPPATAA